jgi:DNA helicase-2/ATP-dependent DNA helicase PcrA
MQIEKIFGPPGTGKTTTLLQIMENELLAGLNPEKLAYLTFTVQARKEAMRRAMEKFNLTEDDLPNFRTLHAICYRELNMTAGGMVKGASDLKELGDSLGVQFTFRQRHRDDDMLDYPAGGEVGDRLLQIDHVRRHNLLSLEEAWSRRFDDDVNLFLIKRFVQEYEAWKQSQGLRDFTDLLEQAEEPLDVEVVIVDEAQDLSKLQWQTLHRLISRAARLYIAGDDDQAIFTWAGADPGSFIHHPGSPRVLDTSYRLPRRVHAVAERISAGIKTRQAKVWNPRPDDGRVIYWGNIDPLRYDAEGSWLVLYRHHYLVSEVEAQVRLLGLPYQRGDRPAPGAEWGQSIIMWERLRRGVELTWSDTRKALEGLAVGHGISAAGLQLFRNADKKSSYIISDLLSAFGLATTKPWYESLQKLLPEDRQYLRLVISRFGAKGLTQVPAIRLSTIHAAKGAEAEHVVLLTDMSRRVKDDLELSPDNERRVFYVGVSRAKQDLTIVGVDNPLFR